LKLTELRCPNCGANLSFVNVVNGKVKCEYCESSYEYEEKKSTEHFRNSDPIFNTEKAERTIEVKTADDPTNTRGKNYVSMGNNRIVAVLAVLSVCVLPVFLIAAVIAGTVMDQIESTQDRFYNGNWGTNSGYRDDYGDLFDNWELVPTVTPAYTEDYATYNYYSDLLTDLRDEAVWEIKDELIRRIENDDKSTDRLYEIMYSYLDEMMKVRNECGLEDYQNKKYAEDLEKLYDQYKEELYNYIEKYQ